MCLSAIYKSHVFVLESYDSGFYKIWDTSLSRSETLALSVQIYYL